MVIAIVILSFFIIVLLGLLVYSHDQAKRFELAIYKRALIDWKQSENSLSWNHAGFCGYFKCCYGIDYRTLPYLIKEEEIPKNLFKYSPDASVKLGRIKRTEALKRAIRKLENDISL